MKALHRGKLAGASLLVLAGLVPMQARAQTAPGGEAEEAVLGEIVVTAQKREQSMQDVPVAVSAVAGPTLEANRIRNVTDLSALAPSLTVLPSAGGSNLPSITMRGARSQASMPGAEKQIAFYIDGVYVGATSNSVYDLPAIERIEVLRGPQGTLFGQSATGGAISIVTPNPTGEFGLVQDFSYGNFDQFRSRTRLNLPAVGPFSASFAYDHSERRGDVRNLGAGAVWNFAASPESGLGTKRSPKWLGDSNTESIQGAIMFEPTDAFRASYKFFWVDTKSSPEAVGSTGVDLGRVGGILNGASPGFGDAAVAALSAQGVPVMLERPNAVNNWFSMPSHFRNQGHILTAQLRLSDSLSVKNTFGYLKGRFTLPGNQLDGLGGAQLAPGVPFVMLVNSTAGHNEQWSNELQINYESDWLTATAGYMHYDLDNVTGGPKGVSNTTAFTPLPGFAIPHSDVAQAVNNNKADAFYVQGEFHVTPQLDLVAGYRLTRDRKRGTADFPGLPTSFTYKDSRPSYSAGANYKVSPDLLLYAKYSTAYVAGGSYAGVPWSPEVAKSWEAGVKSDWLDNRLRANLALYTVKYNDLQVTALGALQAALSGRPELAAVPQLMFNAGDARAEGFELELLGRPVRALTLGANVGYTHFKYLRTDPLVIGPIDAVKPLIRPEWTLNLNAQYDTQPVIGDAYLSFRVDGNFIDSYEGVALDLSPALAGRGHVPSTWLVNGRVALTSLEVAGKDVEVALWGRNLTNDRNMTYVFSTGFAGMATYQRARTYGVDVKFSF